VSTFKFLHAADLHLDSPLLGLATRSPEFAIRVEQASRRAFENLLELAIGEEVAFVILAGDVFDGDLRNYQTGLVFTAGMRRLEDAGIRVFLIAGNHDAENRYASRLKYSGNVHLFAHKAAESVEVEALGVVVHGRSFGQRDVTDNLARDYPPPRSDLFNIGVLHTACVGSEGPHAAYAPCTVEQLVNHGYHYWALGHVHARAVLNEHPHVVYPGNLQGRHARETGPKGATLITVSDGAVADCRHRDLDMVRWARVSVDVAGAETVEAALGLAREAIEPVVAASGDRPTAVRLRLEGGSHLHGALTMSPADVRDDVEALLASLAGEAWLERLDIATHAPARPVAADPTVAGELRAEIVALASGLDAELETCLAEIRGKMPANARIDALFEQLRREAPERAVALALSLVGGGEAQDAD
jgi:DNA repair exonuclease SbcCD nuclease subunit